MRTTTLTSQPSRTVARSANWLLAACFALSAPLASAQQSLTSTLDASDAVFLTQAAHSGHAEVAAAGIALGKARSAAVRAFAQQMRGDHAVMNRELANLGTSKGHAVPRTPNPDQQAQIEQLAPLEPVRFEQRYVEVMGVQAHRTVVALFERTSSDTKDRDIKEFASRTLPALRKHLQMAESLRKSLD